MITWLLYWPLIDFFFLIYYIFFLKFAFHIDQARVCALRLGSRRPLRLSALSAFNNNGRNEEIMQFTLYKIPLVNLIVCLILFRIVMLSFFTCHLFLWLPFHFDIPLRMYHQWSSLGSFPWFVYLFNKRNWK